MTREAQALGEGAKKTAISWTGGKDCNLAMLLAWRNPALDVAALVVFRPEAANFRAHPLPVMQAQAASLGLPLHHVIIGSDYKADYVSGLRNLRAEHGIETVVTGDMDLVGTMKRNWMEECGEEAGTGVWLPLWQSDRLKNLEQILTEGISVVYSCVKTPHFDQSWIGRPLDRAALAEMQAKVEGGLDLGGEKGEYHTMALG
eukprot:CAMPEP_0114122956 /NCGR_PEP_ID=MMETSP0043_2-20121206/7969_1 /TAXON_ID=464988 /ORGANISM="Hemiselmis andersenii, Strain CCMP644" /LENGTH=201 /DNA_ID=CAMNT_0001215701 /DNA_START=33 /DNA_END=634 /DNA_ORIENTATION=-